MARPVDEVEPAAVVDERGGRVVGELVAGATEVVVRRVVVVDGGTVVDVGGKSVVEGRDVVVVLIWATAG